LSSVYLPGQLTRRSVCWRKGTDSFLTDLHLCAHKACWLGVQLLTDWMLTEKLHKAFHILPHEGTGCPRPEILKSLQHHYFPWNQFFNTLAMPILKVALHHSVAEDSFPK